MAFTSLITSQVHFQRSIRKAKLCIYYLNKYVYGKHCLSNIFMFLMFWGCIFVVGAGREEVDVHFINTYLLCLCVHRLGFTWGVSSPLLPCGNLRLNSGRQAQQRAPSPTESSPWSQTFLFSQGLPSLTDLEH